MMRPALIKGTRKYLEGNLEKHKMNAEMLFERGAAVAEHPGYLETIEQELANIAEYSDKLAVLYEHFEKPLRDDGWTGQDNWDYGDDD